MKLIIIFLALQVPYYDNYGRIQGYENRGNFYDSYFRQQGRLTGDRYYDKYGKHTGAIKNGKSNAARTNPNKPGTLPSFGKRSGKR